MKKLVSIVLAAVLSLSCLSAFAFAADEQSPAAAVEEKNENTLPLILVRGMDINGLYYKLDTSEEQKVFDGVKAGPLIKAIIKAAADGVFHLSLKPFTADLLEYVDSLLGKIGCNPDGTSTYDVSVHEYPLSLANYPEMQDPGDFNEYGILKTACETLGAENVYYYNYDWRLDPFYHADKINQMVEQAKADHNCEKVNIICCSMGGIMTESYIYKYGHDSLNRVIFDSSTICGAYVPTDLLNGRVSITAKTLYNFCDNKLAGGNKFLGFLFKVLYKIGLFKAVEKLADWLVPRIIDDVYDDFLKDSFGTMPALWALVDPAERESALEYVFGGEEQKYSAIIALSEQYAEMAENREKFLKEAEADGVNIILVASYGTHVIPVYEKAVENGDGTLETAPMLGNAVVAKYGETLGDGYKADNPERLSPDNVVDLSNALFPETTWAINGSPHVSCSYGSDYSDFIFTLINAEGKVDVSTFPQYPQFMLSSNEQNLELYK